MAACFSQLCVLNFIMNVILIFGKVTKLTEGLNENVCYRKSYFLPFKVTSAWGLGAGITASHSEKQTCHEMLH
jgi:hypothetical protein